MSFIILSFTIAYGQYCQLYVCLSVFQNAAYTSEHVSASEALNAAHFACRPSAEETFQGASDVHQRQHVF